MRKELFLLFGILAFMFVTGSAMAYTQSYYVSSPKTGTSPFDTFGYVNVTGNNTNCTTITTVYAEFDTNGSYNYRFQLYTNNTLRWTNDFSGSGALTCPSSAPIGIYTDTDWTSQGVTAKVTTTNLAVATNVTTHMDMVTTCNTNDGIAHITRADYDQTLTPNSVTGYSIVSPIEKMNSLIYSNLSNADVIVSEYWNHNTPTSCTNWSSVVMTSFPAFNTTQPIWYIPFNSGTGNVTIHMAKYNFGKINHFYLYRKDLNITTDLGTGTTNPNDFFTSVFSLEPNTNYVFIEAWNFNPPIAFQSISVPFFDITINDVTANYSCTYSNCTNQTQTRFCVDTKGIYPNLTSSQPCLPFGEAIFLGFEDSSPFTTLKCVAGFLCSSSLSLVNITALYPRNPTWVVSTFDSVPVFWATVTTEDHSNIPVNGSITTQGNPPFNVNNLPLGSKSLKMWYIPPSPPLQPANVTSVVQCANTSIGYLGITGITGLNDSFFVSFNFTFPSTLMAIQYDVRRCQNAVKQYDACFLLPASCYGFGGNCSAQPEGNYWLEVKDETNNTDVIPLFADVATNYWQRQTLDLDGLIQSGDTYSIQFGIGTQPFDPFLNAGQCVYIDNVMLINREHAITCDNENICIGNDRQIQQVVNGVCITTLRLNDSQCYSIVISQQVTGNQSLFLPIGSICNQVVNQTTNETYCEATKASGFGFSLLFLTPIFWLMMLIIGVMTGVSWLTRHMEVGLGSGILLLVGFTLVFPELLFITIAIVVIVGFIVGRTAVKAVVGGG